MAERTPRLIFRNYFIRTGGILSVSSRDINFPSDHLLDPTINTRWMSRLGWNFVENFNDKVIFQEQGDELVASIQTGNFPSGALAATAVQNAMNTAAEDNTYAVTYNVGTVGFNFAKTAGPDDFLLDFSSEYLRASCHRSLGYDDQVLNGADDYDADRVAMRSEEYILVDVGDIENRDEFTFAGVAGTNATAQLIEVIAGNPGMSSNVPWTDPQFRQFLLDVDGERHVAFFESPQDWDLWALIFHDVENPDAFADCGHAFVGPVLEPTRGIQVGYGESEPDPSLITISESGAVHQDKRPPRRAFSVAWDLLPRAQKELMRAFAIEVQKGGHFWLAMDPQNFPAPETMYGVMTEDMAFQHHVSSGSPPDGFDVSLAFAEEVD